MINYNNMQRSMKMREEEDQGRVGFENFHWLPHKGGQVLHTPSIPSTSSLYYQSRRTMNKIGEKCVESTTSLSEEAKGQRAHAEHNLLGHLGRDHLEN